MDQNRSNLKQREQQFRNSCFRIVYGLKPPIHQSKCFTLIFSISNTCTPGVGVSDNVSIHYKLLAGPISKLLLVLTLPNLLG